MPEAKLATRGVTYHPETYCLSISAVLKQWLGAVCEKLRKGSLGANVMMDFIAQQLASFISELLVILGCDTHSGGCHDMTERMRGLAGQGRYVYLDVERVPTFTF